MFLKIIIYMVLLESNLLLTVYPSQVTENILKNAFYSLILQAQRTQLHLNIRTL